MTTFANASKPMDIRKRVVIQDVEPEIDCGRFPIKRTVGETVTVEADIFADGHQHLSAVLLYRHEDSSEWIEASMSPLVNDRWQGRFRVEEVGRYRYTIQSWVDRFRSWRRDMIKKVEAAQEVSAELIVGIGLIREASLRSRGTEAGALEGWIRRLEGANQTGEKATLALDKRLEELMGRFPDRHLNTIYEKELVIVVDREKARFSSWYEVFPRSWAKKAGRHGTFKDCEQWLTYIAGMGFDVLYLPPIHPIGYINRKGRNNSPVAGPDDPGSPWAIGSAEGGHKSVHPRLGTLQDFKELIRKAGEAGMEIALDLAFQCAPDHPYTEQHPEWFRRRPDGSIQYAENPPKKYEDIYPLDFETIHWQPLIEELRSVIRFWIEQGVRIFRVDNPHTKPLAFWEWLISEIKRDCPEAIFLSEAFTRPKVMYRLAKLGFTQSYTYFAWRNTKRELTSYFTELTRTQVREYFRPSLWPNTPDILTEYLQVGGRAAFSVRLILAATLGANYGIYGPAFELGESRPKAPGSEEYLNSEKYEIKTWPLDRPDSLRHFISRINRIRRENPALQQDWNLRFHPTDNEYIICYSKYTDDLSNSVLVAVNLDPHHVHNAWVDLPLEEMGLDPLNAFQVHDLLSDARFLWQGNRNFLEIDPGVVPGHIFRIRRRVRTERDFDYFM